MSSARLSSVVVPCASARELGAYRLLVQILESPDRMRDELSFCKQLSGRRRQSPTEQREGVAGAAEVLDGVSGGDSKEREEMVFAQLARREQRKFQPTACGQGTDRLSGMYVCTAKRVFPGHVAVGLSETANRPKKPSKTGTAESSSAAFCPELARRPAPITPCASHDEPIGTEHPGARRVAEASTGQVFEPSSYDHRVGIEAQKHIELGVAQGVAIAGRDLHPEPAMATRCSRRRRKHVHVSRHFRQRAQIVAGAVVDDDDGSRRFCVVKHARHCVFDVVDGARWDDDRESARRADHTVCITERPA
jgi:hypothetical protein